jgi:hypothetical protein
MLTSRHIPRDRKTWIAAVATVLLVSTVYQVNRATSHDFGPPAPVPTGPTQTVLTGTTPGGQAYKLLARQTTEGLCLDVETLGTADGAGQSGACQVDPLGSVAAADDLVKGETIVFGTAPRGAQDLRVCVHVVFEETCADAGTVDTGTRYYAAALPVAPPAPAVTQTTEDTRPPGCEFGETYPIGVYPTACGTWDTRVVGVTAEGDETFRMTLAGGDAPVVPPVGAAPHPPDE